MQTQPIKLYLLFASRNRATATSSNCAIVPTLVWPKRKRNFAQPLSYRKIAQSTFPTRRTWANETNACRNDSTIQLNSHSQARHHSTLPQRINPSQMSLVRPETRQLLHRRHLFRRPKALACKRSSTEWAIVMYP